MGLSPRVRGNLVHLVTQDLGEGSIPACAGEPHLADRRFAFPRVYPRVCGGTLIHRRFGGSLEGLSPRVRGNHALRGRRHRVPGSIPACAGEPGRSGRLCTPQGVYPRVCGGTQVVAGALAPQEGLSPRVRGNLPGARRERQPGGSIPACAGEPRRARGSPSGGGVYPRVCGGTGVARQFGLENEGLSPRVRGNHPRVPG